jgi:hypothetical protein
MRLSTSVQRQYPRCAHYIRYKLPEVIFVPVIVKAMRTYGELSRSRFKAALAWNSLPEIRVVATPGAYAAYDRISDPEVLKIDPFTMSRHEAGTDSVKLASGKIVPFLGAKILHELAHWGDARDGAQLGFEEGEGFEIEVYGTHTQLY